MNIRPGPTARPTYKKWPDGPPEIYSWPEFNRKVIVWINEELEPTDKIIDAEPVKKKPRNEDKNSIFGLHAGLIGSQQAPNLVENTFVTYELLKYKAEICSPLSLDPVVYWKVRNLSQIVLKLIFRAN